MVSFTASAPSVMPTLTPVDLAPSPRAFLRVRAEMTMLRSLGKVRLWKAVLTPSRFSCALPATFVDAAEPVLKGLNQLLGTGCSLNVHRQRRLKLSAPAARIPPIDAHPVHFHFASN